MTSTAPPSTHAGRRWNRATRACWSLGHVQACRGRILSTNLAGFELVVQQNVLAALFASVANVEGRAAYFRCWLVGWERCRKLARNCKRAALGVLPWVSRRSETRRKDTSGQCRPAGGLSPGSLLSLDSISAWWLVPGTLARRAARAKLIRNTLRDQFSFACVALSVTMDLYFCSSAMLETPKAHRKPTVLRANLGSRQMDVGIGFGKMLWGSETHFEGRFVLLPRSDSALQG